MYIDVVGLHGTYRAETQDIAKGGIGTIHRTTDPRYVYKQYLDPAKAPNRANLDKLVHIGRDVTINRGLAPGATPESSINWPVDIVLNPGGTIRGVILPAIPVALFDTNFDRPRGIDFLLLPRTQPPTAKARVAILLRLAEILAYLDARGLVHGDINYKNVVWTATPEPTAYLIDCDGLVPQNPPPTTGVSAVYWNDPRLTDGLIKAHDHHSDWYGLALAVYRCLTLEQGNLTTKTTNATWPKPSKIPPTLDPQVAALLHEALSDPLTANRPSPTQWVQALIHAFIPNGIYNDAALDALDAATTSITTFIALPQTNWAQTTGPQPLVRAGTPVANTQPRSPVQTAPPTRRNRRRALVIGAPTAVVLVALVAWLVSAGGGNTPVVAGDKATVASSAGFTLGHSDGSSAPQPATTAPPSPGTTDVPINLAPPPAQPSNANPPPGVAPPAMPTGLIATAISASTIRIQWSDNSANETGFNIYSGTTGASVNVAANTTTYNWGGLAAGTSMCFAISSYNAAGYSPFYPNTSPYYICTTTTSPPPPNTMTPLPSNTGTPPAAPSNLTAWGIETSTSTIRLQWTDNSSSEQGFTIRDSRSDTQVNVAANTTSYDWSGLAPSTTMCLSIRAYNSYGSSNFSAEVCASTPTLASPSNLTVTAISNSTARLRWTDNSDNENQFEIFSNALTTVFVAANTTSYDWGGWPAGAQVCFQIRARKTNGVISYWYPNAYPYAICTTLPA